MNKTIKFLKFLSDKKNYRIIEINSRYAEKEIDSNDKMRYYPWFITATLLKGIQIYNQQLPMDFLDRNGIDGRPLYEQAQDCLKELENKE